MNDLWKNNIITMLYVKQELMKYDITHMWPHYFPEIAATEKQINVLEEKLGYKIDSNYRSFLKSANGWKGVYQTVDLFGTNELLDSSIMQYAIGLLSSIDDNSIESTGFTRDDLIPIATTKLDKDLFVLSSPMSQNPGVVIWFAGEEIDRFNDFNEYFLAMIDYNRDEVEELRKENLS